MTDTKVRRNKGIKKEKVRKKDMSECMKKETVKE